LRGRHIEYIVAPYEADAQLAYLDKKNIIAAIITEDSDLIVYGCKRVNNMKYNFSFFFSYCSMIDFI
jgi:5'-3' exonuclease